MHTPIPRTIHTNTCLTAYRFNDFISAHTTKIKLIKHSLFERKINSQVASKHRICMQLVYSSHQYIFDTG